MKIKGDFMAVKKITSIVVGKRVPITSYFQDSVFILLRIGENREFVDGKWGEKITGYTYDCVDTHDFHHLRVKIEGQETPLMINDELQGLRESGKQIGIEFVNATVMPYFNDKSQSLEDSFRADDVRLVSAE